MCSRDRKNSRLASLDINQVRVKLPFKRSKCGPSGMVLCKAAGRLKESDEVWPIMVLNV
jgi:hypothetical protein